MIDLRSKIKLLSEQPLPLILIATAILPLAFGVLTGLALAWSATLYLLLLIFSVIGGLAAGYEHASPITGFIRGVCGATLFVTGILSTHSIMGSPGLVALPEPHWIFLALNMMAGSLFGALGAWSRQKAERRWE
jgi:hypothetical protein